MALKGVFLRFILSYVPLILGAGYVVDGLDIGSVPALNIGILVGTALWSCGAFTRANNRDFYPREKAMVILGFIGIDLIMSLFGIVVTLPNVENPQVSSIEAVAAALILANGLHALVIIGIVLAAGRGVKEQGSTP